jgi:hypothetical protein
VGTNSSFKVSYLIIDNFSVMFSICRTTPFVMTGTNIIFPSIIPPFYRPTVTTEVGRVLVDLFGVPNDQPIFALANGDVQIGTVLTIGNVVTFTGCAQFVISPI